MTEVKVTERYFTTVEEGMEIVQDAINAGWKHREGDSLKQIKKDIKAIIKAGDSLQPSLHYIYGVEENPDDKTFTIFVTYNREWNK